MAEHVRPGQPPERDASTHQIAPHDRADRRGLDGPRRIGKGEEHPALPMVRAAMLEILGQRGTDLLRQRQHPLAAALPSAKAELPCMPIQVVQFEHGDLAGAQAQTGQQREDRPVTIRRRTRRGRTLQQPPKLLRGEMRRQASPDNSSALLTIVDRQASPQFLVVADSCPSGRLTVRWAGFDVWQALGLSTVGRSRGNAPRGS